MIQKVWSVTVNGMNDCVVMTDFEAMQVKMKYMPNIRMTDMTEKHGMTPDMFNKEERERQLDEDYPFVFTKKYEYEKWRIKTNWTFDKLMNR